jgi:hypothetical protein
LAVGSYFRWGSGWLGCMRGLLATHMQQICFLQGCHMHTPSDLHIWSISALRHCVMIIREAIVIASLLVRSSNRVRDHGSSERRPITIPNGCVWAIKLHCQLATSAHALLNERETMHTYPTSTVPPQH